MTREEAQAIIIKHLLAHGTFDSTNIIRKLAADNPVYLAELAGLIEPLQDWVISAREAMSKGDSAVRGIKAIREGTGLDLWEAKQVWDCWKNGGNWACENYRVTDKMIAAYRTLIGLTDR